MPHQTSIHRTSRSRAWTTAALLHTGMWLTAPSLSAAITLLEATVTITVIATALYAPDHLSTRAFRLLPWSTPESSPQRSGRPEAATRTTRRTSRPRTARTAGAASAGVAATSPRPTP